MKLQIHLVDRDASVRTTSDPFPEEEIPTATAQIFFDDLIEAMIRYDGIGIAATQCGITQRVIVITEDYTPDGEHLVLINPRIVSSSKKIDTMDEGCLSVPGKYGPVPRPAKVRVKALDRNGKPIDLKAKGMFAKILQHEVDHLNATLFIDRALSLEDRPIPHALRNV